MLSTPVRRRTLLASAAALPAAALAAGCGNDSNETRTRHYARYATNFGQLGRDAYAYVALDEGHFDQAGLDVDIVTGEGTTGNLGMLAADQVQFAAIDMAGAAVVEDEGLLGGVRALAAIQQHSLAAVMTTTGTNPMDLAGRVGLPAGAVTETLFTPWATLAGVDLDRVEQVPMSPPELIPALASGQVEAIGQFVVGRNTVEEAYGSSVDVLPYADHLPDLYGVALFTRRDFLETKPDLCRRFKNALLAGLADALDRPGAAGEALARHNPAADATTAAEEMRAMRPYARPTDDTELGRLSQQQLARMVGTMQGAGITQDWVAPEQLVANL